MFSRLRTLYPIVRRLERYVVATSYLVSLGLPNPTQVQASPSLSLPTACPIVSNSTRGIHTYPLDGMG
jgi:hypothetical protein